MCLQELGGCRRFIIELGYASVTLRIVIIRIDYDLARKRLNWNGLVRFQRYRDDNDFARLRSFSHGRRPGVRAKLGDERRQSPRSARITDHYVIAACYGKTGDLTSDVPRADDSYSCHDTYIFQYSMNMQPSHKADLLRGSRICEPTWITLRLF